MSVLVTGASGFVGAHLSNRLIEQKVKTVALLHDCVEWNKWVKQSLKSAFKVHGDIRNLHFLKRVISHYEVNTVYHLAALSIVKHAWKDPLNFFDVNVLGTANVLEACRQLDVEHVLVQSTDKVYGNTVDAEITSELKPTEPYGSSKICTDIAAQTWGLTYGMNIVISRCCNIYGYDWNNRIIPNTIRTCLLGQPPIIFNNDNSKRQYIYIEDVLNALQYLITQKGVYNVASDTVLDQEQVVLNILKFFPSLKPKYVEKPSLQEIKNQSLKVNISPSRWKPQISFQEGIRRTISDFRSYWLDEMD